MLILPTRRAPRLASVLALLATNLVISMPAPPARRSPENASNGFSDAPKILEIQLPLKIATKDDLVAWARYVMGLMASKINITLTTVKEAAPNVSGNVRNQNSAKQSQNIKSSAFRNPETVKQTGNVLTFATSKNFENARYADSLRNLEDLGNARTYERSRNSGTARPLEHVRSPENVRIPLLNLNVPAPKEKKPIAATKLPTLGTTGSILKSFQGNRQTPPNFANAGISRATLQIPPKITGNVNVPGPRIREHDSKGTFDPSGFPRLTDQRLFVPEIPDFVDVKNIDVFRKANTVSPPSRTYLPVTTTDTIEFPTDPFATRYFFDGLERNISSNLGVVPSDIALTTHRALLFTDEIPLPVKSIDLTSRGNSSSSIGPFFKFPFEAVITITREDSDEATAARTEKDKYFVIPTRDPLDEFPPYFETNYTLTNGSDRINVVFDDGSRATDPASRPRKEESKKGGSSRQSSKTRTTTKRPSPIGQLVRMFAALRRNNSLATDLAPPSPRPQKFPVPPRKSGVSTERPSSSREGRRNATSEAQELEDDDEVERERESNESSSNESDDYDDDEDEEQGGGSIKAIIDILQLVSPILEDLSDPESDTDIAEVIEAAIPILQELSEGDGETEGFDVPGVLVPVLLQLSGDDNGRRDSAAILRPLLQLIAPLIGPLVGPLLVPLSHQISHPPGQGGSNVGDLVKSLIGPLSEPAEPGKMSPLSNLISTVVSSLSKNSSYGKGKSDISSLVKAVVAGSVAGTSAGSSNPKDSYAAPTSYGGDYGNGNSYNPPGGPPTNNVNPLLLLGSSIKDILNAIVKVVTSLVSAVTGILGASSSSSQEPPRAYGPSTSSYGTRPSYMVPPREPVTRTTRAPERRFGQ